MYLHQEAAVKDSLGRVGLICPFCKEWIFGPKPIEIDDKPHLQWKCIKCGAEVASFPPYESAGQDKDSFKEEVITTLLSDGVCKKLVRIVNKEAMFNEKALRTLFETL